MFTPQFQLKILRNRDLPYNASEAGAQNIFPVPPSPTTTNGAQADQDFALDL